LIYNSVFCAAKEELRCSIFAKDSTQITISSAVTTITNERSFKMATVAELVKRYQTDKDLQKEVADILADGKISIGEFVSFAKKHGVEIELSDIPKYMEQARQLGFIK